MDVYERYYACQRFMHRRVSVVTVNGTRYEGMIVGVDERNVYIDTSDRAGTLSVKKGKKAKTSAFWYGNGFGFGDAIVPLALFDLLAIALI
ncbi:hypothetical protein [Paenibacillus sp. MBLB4367]|uniref:hypothetical protein n=1 Tax=Paenibacillus sp. MBLB4367 TaxID=3384767 RepID=UPI0039080453